MSPIYLFSHLCQYELILNYFIISVIIHYCFISFVAQIIPVLATGKGTQLAPVSLRYIASLWCFVVCVFCLFYFFSISLLSGPTRSSRRFRLIFCISCPSPGVSCLSKDPCFLLLNNSIRNQDLGTLYAFCPLSVYYNILQCM